jgi:phosphatidylinositol alpha-mannosyltransferase
MKIGLVCPYNMFKGGGVQECVLALRQELENRGHYARIISPAPTGLKNPVMYGVIFVGTAAQIKSPFHTTAQVSVNVKSDVLKDILNKEQFDVLHFHEPWVPILSRQILASSSSKNIATFHAKLPDTVMSKTIEKVVTPYTKPVLKDLNYLTAVSSAATDYISSLTDQHIEIIPNGIDLSKYENLKKKRNKNVLFIGRLEKRKGVKYLIDAFKETSNKKSKLIIAGDGPDRQKLETYVKQLKIEDRVTFLGYITENKKLKLLSTVGLVCSPALYGESFGIVILEAMAMGVPILAGNNPGYSSVLTEEGSISLVNPKDQKSFTKLIELLSTNQSVRDMWLRWAETEIQNYDYSIVVTKYEKLYKKAVINK